MSNGVRTLEGQMVDIHQRSIQPGKISWQNGRIASIERISAAPERFILPGFVDAHIHIESSMLTPRAFSRMALVHGTVATVSDPHEIANVLGEPGIEFMLDDAARAPLKFHFGVPSCVPATGFETAGATLDAEAVGRLINSPRLGYLSEMMNYPGVLAKDPEVLQKLAITRTHRKPIDGHAPGLMGAAAREYFSYGITTDHECTTLDEARDKVSLGVSILIREGSAARNFDALWPLIREHPAKCMLCSDDLHPDDLQIGHINRLVARGIAKGLNLFDLLSAACHNPVLHYGLEVGTLRVGEPADFIAVNDLTSFQVDRTYINGELVAESGRCVMAETSEVGRGANRPLNRFVTEPKSVSDFAIAARSKHVRVIDAFDGLLTTKSSSAEIPIVNGFAVQDTARDLLKIAVINRYQNSNPSLAFIRGFGFKLGAIASSVAHDCHNLVVVGASDDEICRAANAVVVLQGGLAICVGSDVRTLSLPVAGLMSTGDCHQVAEQYKHLNQLAYGLGTSLRAPFMTLAFMALLVIPELKLSDRGLFDGTQMKFVDCFL
jgi:adenine deaminase